MTGSGSSAAVPRGPEPVVARPAWAGAEHSREPGAGLSAPTPRSWQRVPAPIPASHFGSSQPFPSPQVSHLSPSSSHRPLPHAPPAQPSLAHPAAPPAHLELTPQPQLSWSARPQLPAQPPLRAAAEPSRGKAGQSSQVLLQRSSPAQLRSLATVQKLQEQQTQAGRSPALLP